MLSRLLIKIWLEFSHYDKILSGVLYRWNYGNDESSCSLLELLGSRDVVRSCCKVRIHREMNKTSPIASEHHMSAYFHCIRLKASSMELVTRLAASSAKRNESNFLSALSKVIFGSFWFSNESWVRFSPSISCERTNQKSNYWGCETWSCWCRSRRQ